MANEHIVKAVDENLRKLRDSVAEMGGLAEKQLSEATEALVTRHDERAHQVLDMDNRVDAYEAQIEQDAINMLALRQPMANDLREVLAALKIAADLERIGDYAKNMGKRTITLNSMPPMGNTAAIRNLGQLGVSMVHEVLNAYAARDSEGAVRVWRRDAELDELYTSLFRELLTYMMEDARNITACTHLLFVAKNVERIGDHVTNIAETLYFLDTGEHLEAAAARPKSDSSAYTVVDDQGRSRTVESGEEDG